jgi:hypothetical protein
VVGVKLPIWLLTLLLTITCVSGVQMGHASPFQTSTFQNIFNDITNASIQWILTPTISLSKFKSPPGLQLPKWEFPWECEGSFPHTLLHSWEHEMWPGLPSWPALLQALALVANPRLGLWQKTIVYKKQGQAKLNKYILKNYTRITQSQVHLISLQHRLNFHTTKIFGKSNNAKLGRIQDLAWMALKALKERDNLLFVRLDVDNGACTPYTFHFQILKSFHLVHLTTLITSHVNTFLP